MLAFQKTVKRITSPSKKARPQLLRDSVGPQACAHKPRDVRWQQALACTSQTTSVLWMRQGIKSKWQSDARPKKHDNGKLINSVTCASRNRWQTLLHFMRNRLMGINDAFFLLRWIKSSTNVSRSESHSLETW